VLFLEVEDEMRNIKMLNWPEKKSTGCFKTKYYSQAERREYKFIEKLENYIMVMKENFNTKIYDTECEEGISIAQWDEITYFKNSDEGNCTFHNEKEINELHIKMRAPRGCLSNFQKVLSSDDLMVSSLSSMNNPAS
jgi:hypothetical protein